MPHLSFEEVDLYYEQRGEGPDLVWLAGGDQPGSDWHLCQIPAFGIFRNTSYDARGVGQTRCHAPPPWPIEVYGRDCRALIEGVCRPPVILVGLSMGSLIAQQVALDRPDLVRCAVLMGTYAGATGYVREWERRRSSSGVRAGELTQPFATTHYGVFMYPGEVLGDDELWAKVQAPCGARLRRARRGESGGPVGGVRRVRLAGAPARLPGPAPCSRLLARRPDAAGARAGWSPTGAGRPLPSARGPRALLGVRSPSRISSTTVCEIVERSSELAPSSP